MLQLLTVETLIEWNIYLNLLHLKIITSCYDKIKLMEKNLKILES